jgi:hypothetical protein
MLELALRVLNLATPTYNYGDSEVGWRAPSTGAMRTDTCWDLVAEANVTFLRNESGARSPHSMEVLRSDSVFTVAASGDSHTDLCAPDSLVHFGITEQLLRDSGVPAASFSTGAGKYSPLQAYLATRSLLAESQAKVFVLNLYTGNDFLDLMRVDDRPFLEAGPGGYRIQEPVWYSYDAPGSVRTGRVLGLLREVADKTGISRVSVRVRYLRDVARLQGQGLGSVFGYMNDLRRAASPATVYPQAFSAQMLNQYLFFNRFPGSRDESLRRLKFLLEMIRREQPGLMLVFSPIPSYQLVHPTTPNPEFEAVLERLAIPRQDGIEQELQLYADAKRIAVDAGWLFVDNLEALKALDSQVPLYNAADYHIEPDASRAIGKSQAAIILEHLQSRGLSRSAPANTRSTPD